MNGTKSSEGKFTSRRTFLGRAGGGLLGAAVVGLPQLAAATGNPTRWRVACRDSHLKPMGLPTCWLAAKELGVDGLEVNVSEDLACPGLFHPDRKYNLATPDALDALQQDLRANSLAVTALCMSNRFDERLDQEVAWTRKVVTAARKLGVNAIRIDVVPRATPHDQFLPFAVKACRQLTELVKDSPIHFGIENHGNTTNDPDFLARLFDEVGSPRLGLTLDACNFYWFGHPLGEVYGISERFASRACHTHCKNIRYPADKTNERRPMGWEYERYTCPLYDGDIDYRRVVESLRRAGYQGDLCLENECLGQFPKDQHAGILKREVAHLRGLA